MGFLADIAGLTPEAARPFGGKACGLARLHAAGARVPAGFAVTAGRATPETWAEKDRACFAERVRTLTADGPVAVRSSALVEDAANRSFAGMLETVLDVRSAEGAFAAAARCIASGAGERVLAYARSAAPLPVGLLVQRMVAGRAAGVCFTQDPAGRDGAVVVEAVAGRGDSLMSGGARPEAWRVYRSGLGSWEARPESPPSVLSTGQVTTLAAEAADLARRLGEPLDLEWAIDAEGTLFWLQARPITAGPRPPSYVIWRSTDEVDDGPVTVWSNWNVRETLPDPFTPLTWTVWRDVILPMVNRSLFGIRSSSLSRQLNSLDAINGRIYFNMNSALAVPVFGRLILLLLPAIDARTSQTIAALVEAGVLNPRRLPGPKAALFAQVVLAGLRGLARLTVALLPRRALSALEQDAEAIARRPDVAALADGELLQEMSLFVAPDCRRLRDGLQMETVAMAVYLLATRAFERHPRARERLATGLPANPTTQISLGIANLTRAARPLAALFAAPSSTAELLARLAADAEGRIWLADLDDFLARFGHRGPMEFDLGAVRWAEDPTMVLDLVRLGLRSEAREDVSARMTRLADERRSAVEEAIAASAPWRRPLMRWLAHLLELYMPLREAPKHYGGVVFKRMREAARESGARLARRGLLDEPDDVFFLELPELERALEGRLADARPLVAERRVLWHRFRAERAPDILRSDGVPVPEPPAPASDGRVLHGAAVSGGKATGRVRVLREPDPRLVSERDVIVMEHADPGWTPLFPRASAVVMEVGGLMCHAAVVAREMGIPAVFGVPRATCLLRDGERVAVDGSAGAVTRLEADDSARAVVGAVGDDVLAQPPLRGPGKEET